jgi:Uroporphyrinogen decarboxylase (URO-D)
MAGNPTPRDIVRGLLQGVASPRPLFLPIVFSHAARVENMPLRAFLANPTKISNTLRQIRPRLHSDGIACYFDPFLEAAALGATLQWSSDDGPPSLHWPENARKGELPESPHSQRDAAKTSRVAIAIDVIRRLKAVVRDDCLLMASVTGPLTLAALLLQLDPADALGHPDMPPSALDLASAVISGIATAFVEAGAGLVLIREDFLPALSPEELETWFSQLATTINIIRFYDALPVLLLTCKDPPGANAEAIARQPAGCVVCPSLDDIPPYIAAISSLGLARFGVALPPKLFDADESSAADFEDAMRRVSGVVSDLGPAIITTAGDLSAAADMERLNKLWENVRRS